MSDQASTGLPSEAMRTPYWSWQDLLLFTMLALPLLLASTLAVQALVLMLGLRPTKALILLPGQFLGYGAWFGALYLLLRLRYGRPFWKSLGWAVPARGVVPCLFAGPALALAIAVLGAILRTPELEMPIKDLLTDRTSILLVGIFAVTLGPLCEELAFRGFLLPLVVRSFGLVAGVVLSALPFALLHGPQYGWSWRHILLITLAGIAFGWTRMATGSTAATTAMHATYNLTFFATFLLQKKDIPTQW